MDFIDKYFNYVEDYPKKVIADILPMDILWCYISSTFLNGLVNYTDPVKCFIVHRYTELDEKVGKPSWADKELTKQEIWNEVSSDPFRFFHMNLHVFGDDLALLSYKDGVYSYFWFDCDVSDCEVGRFETSESLDQVIKDFEEYVIKQNDEMGYTASGTSEPWEIKIEWLKRWGWLKF